MPVLIIFCILEAPSEIIVGLNFDFFKEKNSIKQTDFCNDALTVFMIMIVFKQNYSHTHQIIHDLLK